MDGNNFGIITAYLALVFKINCEETVREAVKVPSKISDVLTRVLSAAAA